MTLYQLLEYSPQSDHESTRTNHVRVQRKVRAHSNKWSGFPTKKLVAITRGRGGSETVPIICYEPELRSLSNAYNRSSDALYYDQYDAQDMQHAPSRPLSLQPASLPSQDGPSFDSSRHHTLLWRL